MQQSFLSLQMSLFLYIPPKPPWHSECSMRPVTTQAKVSFCRPIKTFSIQACHSGTFSATSTPTMAPLIPQTALMERCSPGPALLANPLHGLLLQKAQGIAALFKQREEPKQQNCSGPWTDL